MIIDRARARASAITAAANGRAIITVLFDNGNVLYNNAVKYSWSSYYGAAEALEKIRHEPTRGKFLIVPKYESRVGNDIQFLFGGKPRTGVATYDGAILELKEEGRIFSDHALTPAAETIVGSGESRVYKILASECNPIRLDDYIQISEDAKEATDLSLDDYSRRASVIVTGSLDECIDLLEKMPTSWTGSTLNDKIEGLSIIHFGTATNIATARGVMRHPKPPPGCIPVPKCL